MNYLKRNAFVVMLALLLGGFFVSPALAQEYKEAYNAGIEAAKAKDYNAAYDEFKRAAQLAEQEGDTDIAQRASKVAAQIDYNLGKQLLDKEDFQGALTRFDAGIALYPQYSNNYVGKALALKKLNRGDEAIQAFQALIAYGEKNQDSQAIADGQQGIRDHFVVEASELLGGDSPSSSDANQALALLEEMQQYVEADADTYYYMAVANNVLGNYAEAVQLADQALGVHRGSRTDAAKIYYEKGEALMYSGDTAAAKAAFENAKYGPYKASAEHYIETL